MCSTCNTTCVACTCTGTGTCTGSCNYRLLLIPVLFYSVLLYVIRVLDIPTTCTYMCTTSSTTQPGTSSKTHGTML